MKEFVVYQSSTGFTKQYADWIAQELHTEAVELKQAGKMDLSQYDRVIFGGWVMGNNIVGLEKARKLGMKSLAVFAVGMSKDSRENRNVIVSANKLEDIPFFYMPGGMRVDKLNFFVRFMLKKIKKSIGKKEQKTDQDVYMEQVLGTNFDVSDQKYIGELIGFVRNQPPSCTAF